MSVREGRGGTTPCALLRDVPHGRRNAERDCGARGATGQPRKEREQNGEGVLGELASATAVKRCELSWRDVYSHSMIRDVFSAVLIT